MKVAKQTSPQSRVRPWGPGVTARLAHLRCRRYSALHYAVRTGESEGACYGKTPIDAIAVTSANRANMEEALRVRLDLVGSSSFLCEGPSDLAIRDVVR